MTYVQRTAEEIAKSVSEWSADYAYCPIRTNGERDMIVAALRALTPPEPTEGQIECVARALARLKIRRNHELDKRPHHDADFFKRAEDFAWKDFTDEANAALRALPLQDGSKK